MSPPQEPRDHPRANEAGPGLRPDQAAAAAMPAARLAHPTPRELFIIEMLRAWPWPKESGDMSVSVYVTAQVWKLRGLSPTQKLLLLALADLATHNGIAWPSVTRLAQLTGLHVRTVQRAKEELIEAGLLKVVEAGGRKKRKGAGRANVLQIADVWPLPAGAHNLGAVAPDRPPTPCATADSPPNAVANTIGCSGDENGRQSAPKRSLVRPESGAPRREGWQSATLDPGSVPPHPLIDPYACSSNLSAQDAPAASILSGAQDALVLGYRAGPLHQRLASLGVDEPARTLLAIHPGLDAPLLDALLLAAPEHETTRALTIRLRQAADAAEQAAAEQAGIDGKTLATRRRHRQASVSQARATDEDRAALAAIERLDPGELDTRVKAVLSLPENAYLANLIARGKVSEDPRKSRSLRLLLFPHPNPPPQTVQPRPEAPNANGGPA